LGGGERREIKWCNVASSSVTLRFLVIIYWEQDISQSVLKEKTPFPQKFSNDREKLMLAGDFPVVAIHAL